MSTPSTDGTVIGGRGPEGGTYDLVVIGGGPAGVAGALTAALAGLRVALLDSGLRLGGQYFRHTATEEAGSAAPGGGRTGGRTGARASDGDGRTGGKVSPDLARFLRQARDLEARADVLLRHQVWNVSHEPDGEFLVHCATRGTAGRWPDGDRTVRERTSEERPPELRTDGERVVEVRARRLLIATGAHDRPLPFPGWDLPGVLTAGGAQALLKGAGVVAGRRIVVSGTGPFLLPVAAGLAAAGARVLGVHEANGGLGLARHPLRALGKAGEAAGYAAALARHRVPYRTRQAVVAAHGEREVQAVTVARLDADWNVLATRVVECDTVAVGYGFVPQIELGTQLGCATRNDVDGSPVLDVDVALRTSVPGVWAAGEPTGVAGWRPAELEGRIAGHAIATAAGRAPYAGRSGAAGRSADAGRSAAAGRSDDVGRAADAGRTTAPGGPTTANSPTTAGRAAVGAGAGSDGVPAVLLRRRERGRGFGVALQEAYPVKAGWRTWLRDDTLVCRCEEVPLARVREAQELGATDARAVKLLARPGMGWCQGRICGYAVSCLAGEPPQPPRRPIAQPVTLGALAELTTDPDERPAH